MNLKLDSISVNVEIIQMIRAIQFTEKEKKISDNEGNEIPTSDVAIEP